MIHSKTINRNNIVTGDIMTKRIFYIICALITFFVVFVQLAFFIYLHFFSNNNQVQQVGFPLITESVKWFLFWSFCLLLLALILPFFNNNRIITYIKISIVMIMYAFYIYCEYTVSVASVIIRIVTCFCIVYYIYANHIAALNRNEIQSEAV